MAKSDLTAARLRELLQYDPETGAFIRIHSRLKKSVGKRADVPAANGYLRVCIGSDQFLAHRLAWLYVHDVWPEPTTDHINGVRTDNRIANLRVADHTMQRENVRVTRNKVGAMGVTAKPGGKFEAQISTGGDRIPLGYYKTVQEASAAYTKAKLTLHPGYAG